MNNRSLPAGYQIHNYRIEKFLGEGGFGITYKAVDLNLDRPVAIKEYMPLEFATRTDVGDVEPKNADCEEIFQNGLMSYVKEAQALARFKHDNIVQVYTFLRHHNTAYIIMEYVDGMTFSQWLRKNKSPSEMELAGIMCPILMGLHQLHKIDLLHRDIKPDNIYICANNRPVLLDFGAVRHSMRSGNTSDMSGILLTEGFAPPEQYGKVGQGPWTDVYAVGACLHLAVSGKMVANAIERTTQVVNDKPDPQPRLVDSALRDDYSEHFLEAIEQSLSLKPKDRIADALSLKYRLLNVNTSNQEPDTDNPANRQTVVRDEVEMQHVALPDTQEMPETVFRAAPGVGESHPVVSDARPAASARIQNAGDMKAAGSNKFKLMGAALVGLLLLAVLTAKYWPVGAPTSANDLQAVKAMFDQKLQIVDVMKLPQTGDFVVAMTHRQRAVDMESKKVQGSVKDITDTLKKANMSLDDHIQSTAPEKNAQLLESVTDKTERAKLLGVLDIELPELSEFTASLDDVDELRARFEQLSLINEDIDSGLQNNARSYLLGSSAQDIEEALEICREYSDQCQREWYEDEAAREAVLSPFELDKSEITVAQFRRYAQAQGIVTSAETNGFSYTVDPGESFAVVRSAGVDWKNAYNSLADIDNLPVIHINRAEAMDYCQSVGGRLPTEAEWEYVARGPERLKFAWGNTWDASRVAWAGDGNVPAMPINSFPANEQGYFDFAGSVTEWTSTDSVEDDTAILKGGSRFYSNVANFRLAVRRLEFTDYTGDDVGFRCARSLEKWPVE